MVWARDSSSWNEGAHNTPHTAHLQMLGKQAQCQKTRPPPANAGVQEAVMASWESLPEEQRQARIMQLQMAASMKRGKAISEWVVCRGCVCLLCPGCLQAGWVHWSECTAGGGQHEEVQGRLKSGWPAARGA